MLSRRAEERKKNLKRLALGSAVAAGAGYLTGVLTAPKSGKQTRKDIKDTAERGWSEAERDIKKLHNELDKLVHRSKKSNDKLSKKAQSEFDDLVDKAKDTKEKAREMLTAVRQGGAEDKDLKKAIKEANDALEHIRKYIKK